VGDLLVGDDGELRREALPLEAELRAQEVLSV
jgi:hypothetical protein